MYIFATVNHPQGHIFIFVPVPFLTSEMPANAEVDPKIFNLISCTLTAIVLMAINQNQETDLSI